MTALAPVNLSAMEAKAKQWIRDHPSVIVKDLSRARRIADEGARAAFAVITRRGSKQALGTLNGNSPSPCTWRGLWSHCFCESCDVRAGPPVGLCMACDGDRMICKPCKEAGRSWEQSHAEHDQHMMEVSGYTTDDGMFHRVVPPLQIPVGDLTPNVDGEYDMTEVMERILSERARATSTS